MNKIVRHYPVDQLPADLRADLPEHGLVKIEFEAETEPPRRRPIAHLVGTGQNLYGSDQDVLDYIAELREDRDELG
jgi:hypothetical protein